MGESRAVPGTLSFISKRHEDRLVDHFGKVAQISGFTYAPCTIDMSYGACLRETRTKGAVTMFELASQIGISFECLAKIEAGLTEPTEEQKETLEAFLAGRL